MCHSTISFRCKPLIRLDPPNRPHKTLAGRCDHAKAARPPITSLGRSPKRHQTPVHSTYHQPTRSGSAGFGGAAPLVSAAGTTARHRHSSAPAGPPKPITPASRQPPPPCSALLLSSGPAGNLLSSVVSPSPSRGPLEFWPGRGDVSGLVVRAQSGTSRVLSSAPSRGPLESCRQARPGTPPRRKSR